MIRPLVLVKVVSIVVIMVSRRTILIIARVIHLLWPRRLIGVVVAVLRIGLVTVLIGLVVHHGLLPLIDSVTRVLSVKTILVGAGLSLRLWLRLRGL